MATCNGCGRETYWMFWMGPDNEMRCSDCYRRMTEEAGPVGWVCPICGRGVSPYTQVCDCTPSYTIRVEGGTGETQSD